MVWNGDNYQQRFDALASTGVDVHGEAAFITRLSPATVLDAGCGTGRVARELARHGIDVVGVDADPSMIATAQRLAGNIEWHVADVANLNLSRVFDVVVMAGNVPLFTAPGTHRSLVEGCARHVKVGGCLVTGFQCGRGYEVADYDDDCGYADLELSERWSTWARDEFPGDGTYVVSVHGKPK